MQPLGVRFRRFRVAECLNAAQELFCLIAVVGFDIGKNIADYHLPHRSVLNGSVDRIEFAVDTTHLFLFNEIGDIQLFVQLAAVAVAACSYRVVRRGFFLLGRRYIHLGAFRQGLQAECDRFGDRLAADGRFVFVNIGDITLWF